MRKLRLAGVAGLATAALFALPSSASAQTMVVRCPDDFTPIPAVIAPADKKDRNHNGNLFVCAKGPQGSNGHFNVTDDHGEVVSPTQWDVNPVEWGVFVVTYALDENSTYYLDNEPDDIVDDLLP
jgi:hypothetical protein